MQQEKRDLSHLCQGLANIIEAAEQNQVDAKIANQLMVETASKLDQIVNELKNQFQDKVESSTTSITKKISNDLTTKFREADYYAERASKRYESVSFWIPFKYFAIVIIGGVSILAGATMIVLKIVPTASEIEQRFNEMKQIELSISKSKIKLDNCGESKRRCVKVNKNEYEKNIIYGDNGEVYLILDGY
jgi:hypothetical protein